MASQVLQSNKGSFFKPQRLFPKRGGNLFPIGPRTKRRLAENAELNKLRLDRCEIRIPGVCVDRLFLTWAHSKKSRFILTSKDWREAARACQPCHRRIEALGHRGMHAAVTEAIKRRKSVVEKEELLS